MKITNKGGGTVEVPSVDFVDTSKYQEIENYEGVSDFSYDQAFDDIDDANRRLGVLNDNEIERLGA